MNKNKIKLLTEISIFSAIIVILQILATFINFGSFPITLTLIPIIVGSFVYGPLVGALLGLVFGMVVSIMVIIGSDPSGATMFLLHPVITVVTCLLKGALAGYLSGLCYKLFKNINQKVRIIISSAICPIVNTLILSLSLLIFFNEELKILIGMFVSVNFVIELLINVLLAPGLTNLIRHSINRYEKSN